MRLEVTLFTDLIKLFFKIVLKIDFNLVKVIQNDIALTVIFHLDVLLNYVVLQFFHKRIDDLIEELLIVVELI